MWFPWLYFIVLTFRLFCVPAQSIDEEEAVHLVEGSGNYASDDEDIEGSSLPPDAHYATTPPVMHPRFTHSTTTRRRFDSTLKYTTLIKSQRVTTFATSTPSIITHPRLKDTSARGKLFSTSTTVIILGLLVLLLIAVSRKKSNCSPTIIRGHSDYVMEIGSYKSL
ncbi:hypothetical protein KIN20_001631 [Parelaphostrongylus tenuis]|uniref:Uncharacterized protein n=1 Tax=Parelaphostrongylus tenuis TaxID=148309 RepID=A0AAD5QES6_PARTN|nr:hypothetical protein KIN20_001631 [Parelaphostrongylus tenuis]